jgi:hypothetical protein
LTASPQPPKKAANDNADTEKNGEAGALKVALKLDRNEFFLGESIAVEYEMTNAGQEPVPYGRGAYFHTLRINDGFRISAVRIDEKGKAIGKPVANWPEAPCIRADERTPPVRELWNISIPMQPERPIGHSVLDHCTPIFIDRGGKHSDVDVAPGSSIVMEGFYQNTGTGGRIEVNLNALMHTTEKYRAVVLGHEELHGVLEWFDPVVLNQAILPTDVIDKARAQLREIGYEGEDLDGEILPRDPSFGRPAR